MYKMSKISKEAYKKCEIETIDRRQFFGLVKKICKQNQVTVIGQQFLTDVTQINKNTDIS